MTYANKKDVKQLLEKDILAVANDRDKQAYTRLFEHFLPLVKSFCLASSPGATVMAGEVSQEVMLKIWRKAHTFNPKVASTTTWVYTLARNARIDYLRKNSKYVSDIDPEFVYATLEDENADPFTHAVQKRDAQFVKDALAALPEDQRQVIQKVYMEGKTHTEVAEVLALPLGTVKSRVRLALKKLAIRGGK